ncbi:MAG: winged helix-turn-helix transcriptional regulator [Saprospiraceae bacterium]|nr:winged helix-turn-helix transcriptional regulator [Saprospiraceae bacterium]
MDYDFLKKIIDKVALYELEASDSEWTSLQSFAEWLLDANKTVEKAPHTEGGKTNIGELVGLMYRYGKNYSKKALAATPLQTIDEFTYLATLLEGDMTKTQLINRHIQEKTSGMAIIKRLLDQNWVSQRENEADKRSQILSLTDSGRAILRGAFFEMSKVSTIVTADLTEAEKAELVRILGKLELFHRTVFDNEKTLDLDIIIEKYKL